MFISSNILYTYIANIGYRLIGKKNRIGTTLYACTYIRTYVSIYCTCTYIKCVLLICYTGPGVYSFPFFTEEFCEHLTTELDHIESSPVPKGRPNTMNNYGVSQYIQTN